MKSFRVFFVVLVSLAFSYGEAKAQDFSFPQMKGYKIGEDYPVYTPDDLWNYIDGAADAYLALGFLDLTIKEYVKGKKTIKAEIYRFANDSQAFGIYSLERAPDYNFISAGVQGYNEEGVVNFYKGVNYVKIMTQSKSKKVNESMISLAGLIADRISGRNDFPVSVKSFPKEGLLKNMETYILEGVLGHDYLRGAFRASYETEGDRFEIYVIEPASFADAALAVSKLTNSPAATIAEDTDKYIFEDGYNGILFLVRKGAKIVIISGLGRDKASLAEHYLELVANK